MTAFISTTGRRPAHIKVSAIDFDWLNQYRWRLNHTSNGVEYAVAHVDRKRRYMHRMIAGVDGLHVDHINGDTLDNRRENLRAVTQAVNNQNKTSLRASKTGVLGVMVSGSKFVACISRDKKRHYLGTFATVEEAERAVYDFKDAYAHGDGEVRFLLEKIQRLERELAEERARAVGINLEHRMHA